MELRDMMLKKLQLVIDEHRRCGSGPNGLIFLVKTKTARILRALEPPTDGRENGTTTRHTFHSEIGARSVLRVVDEVLRTDELW